MSRSAKVTATALLFVAALATVVLSAATHRGIPLFFAWVPLIGVGWVLTRPEPGEDQGRSDENEGRSDENQGRSVDPQSDEA